MVWIREGDRIFPGDDMHYERSGIKSPDIFRFVMTEMMANHLGIPFGVRERFRQEVRDMSAILEHACVEEEPLGYHTKTGLVLTAVRLFAQGYRSVADWRIDEHLNQVLDEAHHLMAAHSLEKRLWMVDAQFELKARLVNAVLLGYDEGLHHKLVHI